ncbi:MAG: SH3 domain-containing protein [Thermomicrobiales bacterium]|nr:SH3 domain-containing protein [Thermomicrobiales bacterium]
MPKTQVHHRAAPLAARLALGACMLALSLGPLPALAQTTTPPASTAPATTTRPVVYAVTDLNLRKGPGSNDAIVSTVPLGAEVTPVTGVAVTNDYRRVTYNGVTGWVVALGLVDSPDEVDSPAAPASASPAPLSTYNADVRLTLTPLMLRSGPDVEAAPITGMPEGATVTLTREGAENGYVTVDYGGTKGWAYADLLARPDEVR